MEIREGGGGEKPAPSFTTISTVAVQAGQSQLVVSALKSGRSVHLHLAEFSPALLQIGADVQENKVLLEEHCTLLARLKQQEGAVLVLLSQADRTAEEEEGGAYDKGGGVYEAMAASLSEGWSLLLLLLHRRQRLLQQASIFYQTVEQFSVCLDEAEKFEFRVNEHPASYSCIRRALLETSLQLLTGSAALLHTLSELQTSSTTHSATHSTPAVLHLKSTSDAESGCTLRVEQLVEKLQDRRSRLEQKLRGQQRHQEAGRLWRQREEEVRCWLQTQAEVFLSSDQLGSSLEESHKFLLQNTKLHTEAQAWSLGVEELLVQAEELQAACDLQACGGRCGLSDRTRTLRELQGALWSRMKSRRSQLQLNQLFYCSAYQVLTVLQGAGDQLRTLMKFPLELSELTLKQQQLQETIRASATEALSTGHALLHSTTVHRSQLTAVQSMLGRIQDAVEAVNTMCTAHLQLANHRQRLVTSCDRLMDKVQRWLRHASSVVARCSESEQLPEAQQRLQELQEVNTETEAAGGDADTIRRMLEQLHHLENPGGTRPPPPPGSGSHLPPGGVWPHMSGRFQRLRQDLRSLGSRVRSHIDHLRTYVTPPQPHPAYSHVTEEQMEALRKVHTVGAVEAQPILRDAQHLANCSVNTVTTVSTSRVVAVQQTVERLNKTKLNQKNKFNTLLQKTLRDLRSAEDFLLPSRPVDVGSEAHTVSQLLQNLQRARPHLTCLEEQVEVVPRRWAELGRGEGAEVEEQVMEVKRLHRRVTQRIQDCEEILKMADSFHRSAEQLNILLQSVPDSSRSRDVQKLFTTTEKLQRELCSMKVCTGFSVCGLQDLLKVLETKQCEWQCTARACTELSEVTTHTHTHGLKGGWSLVTLCFQLRHSFEEVGKRGKDLKLNFLKRNDRSTNTKEQEKELKNHLQQVQGCRDRLQGLLRRHSRTSLFGPGLGDAVTTEMKDVVEELGRQMEEFDRDLEQHKGALQSNCKLQQAMEEYQCWYEEVSTAVLRVQQYSSQCCGSDAVSALHKHFVKFVVPTLCRHDDKVQHITQMAAGLHGAEESRRLTQRTVRNHEEVTKSISELRQHLMRLENRLQVEEGSRCRWRSPGGGGVQVEGEESMRMERIKAEKKKEEIRVEQEKKVKRTEKEPVMEQKMKVERESEELDNRRVEEISDLVQLKETGHTPELTAKHDGKEGPVKKQALRKDRLQEQTDRKTSGNTDVTTDRQSVVADSSTFCCPLEAKRRVDTLLSQSQPSSGSRTVLHHGFSDVQMEFGKRPEDTRTGGLSEAELQQQEVMSEDELRQQEMMSEVVLRQQEVMSEESLSTDEYDCVSPDDVSLPPLSETPESSFVQSDVDDTFCVSRSGVHVERHRNVITGSLSHQTERAPSPSGGRLRSESNTFVCSSTLHPSSSLDTRGSSPAPYPQETGISLGIFRHTASPGGSAVYQRTLPERTLPVTTLPERTLPVTTLPETTLAERPLPERTLLERTLPVTTLPETTLLERTLPERTLPERTLPERTLPERTLPVATLPETTLAERTLPDRTHSDRTLPERTLPETTLPERTPEQQDHSTLHWNIPQREASSHCSGFSQVLIGCKTSIPRCSHPNTVPQSTASPHSTVPQSTASPHSTVPQRTASPHSTVPQSTVSPHITVPQNTTLQTPLQQRAILVHAPRYQGLHSAGPAQNGCSPQAITSPDVTVPRGGGQDVPPASCTICPTCLLQARCGTAGPESGSSTSSNSSRQSPRLVSLHEPRRATYSQQCVHAPSWSFRPPSQANPHEDTPSPLHLLTPEQDPDGCCHLAIREQITLPPQNQGPPLWAPPPPLPPRTPAECFPQGKSSKVWPPCFTRPLSRASVMGGSPVMLEVEVSGHPEPTLIWLGEGLFCAAKSGVHLSSEQSDHFLFPVKTLHSDAPPQDKQEVLQAAAATLQDKHCHCSRDSSDVMSLDWLSRFGMLCVLLWLLYLLL